MIKPKRYISKENQKIIDYINKEFKKRKFVFYFWFTGWDNISFGISINLFLPNVEIHLPFGFIRIGFSMALEVDKINEYLKNLKEI